MNNQNDRYVDHPVRWIFIATLSVLWISCAPAHVRGNVTIDSVNTAKKHVYAVHQPRSVTFYCGCTYQKKSVVANGCSYTPRGTSMRARRVEVDHIVPASHFGRTFSAWTRGDRACIDSKGNAFKGRNCSRKTSELFRRMESDLYNLRPAIGELNQARRDYKMGEIPGESRAFGRCDVEVANQLFEPPPKIRGDIARIWFYMEWAYPGRITLTDWDRTLYTVWAEADPVDDTERTWANAVFAIQGNPNPFVKKSD